MDEILVKYIIGEASEMEVQEVEKWIHADVKHRTQLEQMQAIWIESKKVAVSANVNADEAWKRFEQKLTNNGFTEAIQEMPIPAQTSKRRPLFIRSAAAALLVLTFGLATYFYSISKAEIVIAANNQVLVDTLPDNSVITLNKNAVLAYHKSFNKKSRKVELAGEAFFDVAPNKQKPFEISVNEVLVHVVGTSFNIKSDELTTEIIVATGVVTVQSGSQKVKVLPQQKVVIKKNSASFKVENTEDVLYNYYRTQEFVCNNTPLQQLVDALNKSYNTQISIASKTTAQLTLTSHFKEQSLNDILKVVTETFNLKIEQRDGEIVLY